MFTVNMNIHVVVGFRSNLWKVAMSDEALVTAADVARLAGVGRAAVSNWRRRHADFPDPVIGHGASPAFRLADVEQWLRRQGKLERSGNADTLWRALDAERGDRSLTTAVAEIADYLRDPLAIGRLGTRTREILEDLDEPAANLIDQLSARLFERQQRQHLATPLDLARLMVELAGPIAGVVYDPACGPGNALRAAADSGADCLFGQEIDSALAQLAQSRLRLVASATVAQGDSLRADAFPDLRADAVVCDPPFGYRDWGHDELGVDPRWEYGFPVKGEAELAWLQHSLAHVKPGGSVVMALPAGVSVRRSGRSVRQSLLRRGVVRAVIALPAGLLMSTGIPIHLWVLRNPEQTGVEPVLLVDTGRHRPERRGLIDWPALREAVLTPWRQFAETGTVDEVAGSHRMIEAIDLLDEDVDFTPSRHVPLPAPDVDAAKLKGDRGRLAALLKDLGGKLPEARRSEGGLGRPTVTINDLARGGALVLRQQARRLEVSDDTGVQGQLILTGGDIVSGVAPSVRLAGPPEGDLIELRRGDIVVPSVLAGDGRPVAITVEEDGWVLGPNTQLVRADPDRLDADFLAGQLRSAHAARATSSTASGVHRLDIRRVEIPVLNIDEQRRLGACFRQIQEFETGLREASALGARLSRQLADGLAAGELDLGGS
jgi:predicted RNA methylase/predicted DNA-binding transcriptional regulator AlpA